MSVQEGKSHWEIRGCLEYLGGTGKLNRRERQSQVVANGKRPGDDVTAAAATPQASNACVMGNRSYGFGATPTLSHQDAVLIFALTEFSVSS